MYSKAFVEWHMAQIPPCADDQMEKLVREVLWETWVAARLEAMKNVKAAMCGAGSTENTWNYVKNQIAELEK